MLGHFVVVVVFPSFQLDKSYKSEVIFLFIRPLP